MKKLLILIISSSAVLVTGCSWMPRPYTIDVPQGNIVDQDKLNQVKPGMSQRQVTFLLGTPLIEDPFHKQRWDYYYSLKKGGKLEERERVTMFFADGKLARLEGTLRPQPGAAQASADKPEAKAVEVNPTPKPEKKGFFTRMLEKIGIGK